MNVPMCCPEVKAKTVPERLAYNRERLYEAKTMILKIKGSIEYRNAPDVTCGTEQSPIDCLMAALEEEKRIIDDIYGAIAEIGNMLL